VRETSFSDALQRRELLPGGLVVACLYNNLALQLLGQGSDLESSKQFLEQACAILSSEHSSPTYLHPFYNLTLLFLQNSETAEQGVERWSTVRRLKGNASDDFSSSMKWLMEQRSLALQGYSQARANHMVDSIFYPAWLSQGTGGLRTSNVRLLDCWVLQYQIQRLQNEYIYRSTS
jgi:hypothetical protein